MNHSQGGVGPKQLMISTVSNGIMSKHVPDINEEADYSAGLYKRAESKDSLGPKKAASSVGGVRQRKQITAVAAHAKQKFSAKKRKKLATFSSVNYAPTHSFVYKEWLKKHPLRLGLDRWILMVIIGVVIGLIAWLLKQCLTALAQVKWDKSVELANEGNLHRCFAWTAGISTVMAVISSVLVAFVHPPAAGSGVPEVLAYLNGVIIHGMFSFKTLVAKFTSLVMALSAGFAAGTQGPVVAMGGIVGLGIGQFKSKTFNVSPNYFSRFRTPEDRRSFTTAGVAAGVAAAFNAPIGGLLFAMEDLSSFWSRRLAWQTFFCCGMAATTANVLNVAFSGFDYKGSFGMFSVIAQEDIRMNVIMIGPGILLGIAGGIFGAIFTRLNNFIAKTRVKLIAKIPHPTAQNFTKVFEVIVIVIIMSAIAVYLPSAFECTAELPTNATAGECAHEIPFTRLAYDCNTRGLNNKTRWYSESASILMAPGTAMMERLQARGIERWFGWKQTLAIFPLWFFMTIWTAGSAIAGGTFLPNIIAGSLYGRAAGVGVMELYRWVTGHAYATDEYWRWIDPGNFAIMGAGSLLGGVNRLSLAITVIIVEMTQDIDIIIPLLFANFTSKVLADFLSKPLYKYQLDMKALPYLDPELQVVIDGELVNLEQYTAGDVCSSPVRTIRVQESVAYLAQLLLGTEHGGFPVIIYDEQSRTEQCYGLISRTELYVILWSEDVNSVLEENTIITPRIDYEELSVDYIADPTAVLERIRTYARFKEYQSIYVNLENFVNQSAPKVDDSYSLSRTHSLFRTLGLRHLVVIDLHNRVKGIITRKDLMAFSVEERLLSLEIRHRQALSNLVGQVPIVTASGPYGGYNNNGYQRRGSAAPSLEGDNNSETPL